ncbi:ImmA/IrrE family metallo-endopeptidase [Nakamurella aerolata]|uniref:ImmA/IrrE family metallo-endopeptidase n=1 Tax=Nakamurella aerolata TaxID=1656892 RepID=A0A849A8H5_9ACTN|nr:ImmA/IrrE family metallo-endopeptidase [Nakamurella aerolata]
MTVRIDVSPSVLDWALSVTQADRGSLQRRFAVAGWQTGQARPTLNQLRDFARAAGVPFGYLVLADPPRWTLPIADFREGFEQRTVPSANLIAVVSQSQRRQEWYREYALGIGIEPLSFVGSAAAAEPFQAAATIRAALHSDVSERYGGWDDTRKVMLRNFEALGGLTVATSVVGNNSHRRLDEKEFRGFTLVDQVAPLVFVNTSQTVNGQIFTLAHEFAHVWRGISGIGDEEPRSRHRGVIERWCNAVASEILVPRAELERRYPEVEGLPLPDLLDRLAHDFRCGTLVVLQALRDAGLRRFESFDTTYDRESQRLATLANATTSAGGDSYNVYPFRVGERLSRALISDALEGRTSIADAMQLMSMKSLSTFDEYAKRLGAA